MWTMETPLLLQGKDGLVPVDLPVTQFTSRVLSLGPNMKAFVRTKPSTSQMAIQLSLLNGAYSLVLGHGLGQ
jgi:hypothetical protein